MKPMYYLLTVGGSEIKATLSSSEATSGINDFLTTCGTAVGAIIIALAALKILIALADENVASRQQASLLLGVGLIFVSISTIVPMIVGDGISSESDYTQVAQNILKVIGLIGTFASVIMLAFGVFSYIMAIINEQAEQQAKATSSILVGFGFMSLKTVCSTISEYLGNGNTVISSYIGIIISCIAKIGLWGGRILLPMAVFKLVISVKEEDSKARMDALKLFIVAIGLMLFNWLLGTIGLKTGAPTRG